MRTQPLYIIGSAILVVATAIGTEGLVAPLALAGSLFLILALAQAINES